MTQEEREALGKKGRQHVAKNYNFEDFNKRWIDLMTGIHEQSGSWDTRKGYKRWEAIEIL